MQIMIKLPEDIAVGFESKWKNLPVQRYESLCAYRESNSLLQSFGGSLFSRRGCRSTPF